MLFTQGKKTTTTVLLSSQDDAIVELAAKHLYIQHGSDNSLENVKEAVQDCIHNAKLEAKSEAKWIQMVSTAHAQVSCSWCTMENVKKII